MARTRNKPEEVSTADMKPEPQAVTEIPAANQPQAMPEPPLSSPPQEPASVPGATPAIAPDHLRYAAFALRLEQLGADVEADPLDHPEKRDVTTMIHSVSMSIRQIASKMAPKV